MAPSHIIVIDAYSDKLDVLISKGMDVWNEAELPYSKEEIKAALLVELKGHYGTPAAQRNHIRIRCLNFMYVYLASFIPADDAQLLNQNQRLWTSLYDKLSRGLAVTKEEHSQSVRAYEFSGYIQTRIRQEERRLLAELVINKAGGEIFWGSNTVELRLKGSKLNNTGLD